MNLVRKVSQVSDYRPRYSIASCYIMSKNNKFNIFEQFLNISAFNIGVGIVEDVLQKNSLNGIKSTGGFETMIKQNRYIYLSTLISLVEINDDFEGNYFKKSKENESKKQIDEKEKQTQQPQNNGLIQLQTNVNNDQKIDKSNPYLFLGIDSISKSYHYFISIPDRIFYFDSSKYLWGYIDSQQSKFLMAYLLKRQNDLTCEQVYLLSNVAFIYQKMTKINKDLKNYAFDQQSHIKDTDFKHNQMNKLLILKQKFMKLDIQYSKFLGDCFNYRWASKQRRLKFHDEITKAEQINELLSLFSQFYNETRHKTYRYLQKSKQYDYNLDTEDCSSQNFKQAFLRMNYLYVQGVFKMKKEDEKFSQNLYNHIKSFISESENIHLNFQYMYIFIQSMTGIIKNLYNSCYDKRMKQIEFEEAKQKQAEKIKNKQQNNKVSRKLMKNGKGVIDSGSQSQSEDSKKTVEMRSSVKRDQNKKRLRNKARVFYGATASNSTSIQNQKNSKASKNIALKSNKGNKSKKRIRLTIDSDSSGYQNYSSSQSNALSLDKYKYDAETEVPIRRALRSKDK